MTDAPPDLKIEQLRPEDIPALLETFAVWHKTREQFERYLAEQERGERTVFLAWLDGKVVGYVTILWVPRFEIFKEENIPEIVDLNVITEHQRKGIGTALIIECELECYGSHAVIGISVEISPEYSVPQIMYPKKGFLPINNPEPGQLRHFIKMVDIWGLPKIAVDAILESKNVSLWMQIIIRHADSVKGNTRALKEREFSISDAQKMAAQIERSAKYVLDFSKGLLNYYEKQEYQNKD